MPDLQTQEMSLTHTQPEAQGTNQTPGFVEWTRDSEHERFSFLPLPSESARTLGRAFAPPSPWFPGTNRSKPFQKLGLPSASCLEGAESAACLAPLRNSACDCWQWRRLSGMAWPERHIHTGSFLCSVSLITWLQVVGFGGLGWRDGEGGGQKGARRVGTKQP